MKAHDYTLSEVINVFGHESQLQMAAGEMGELLTLYGRAAQGRASKEEWIEEIADVTLMMRQLALMFGVNEVEAEIEKKMARLHARLAVQREEEAE